MPKKVAQKNCPNQILAKNTKKILFGVPETQTARQSKRVIFRKKIQKSSFQKLPKKSGQKKNAQKKCPTKQRQNYGHQLWSMSKWSKQMPVDIGPYRVFQFLGQKNWTLLSMSIFCGILFGQTKTWPISMFTDVACGAVPLGFPCASCQQHLV